VATAYSFSRSEAEPAVTGKGRREAAFLFLLLLAPAWSQAQDVQAGAKKAETCVACHGPNGDAPTQPQFPILAAQTARYTYLELRDFQEGRRTDPMMDPIAKPLSRQDMQDLAAYFAAQKPRPNPFKADPDRVAKGKAKADETLCTMCHLGGFIGQNEIPRVAGQMHDYVVKQLKDFKERKRTNDAGSMTSVSRTLNDDDIENLAHYLASLY
jgi:cytochrome c553